MNEIEVKILDINPAEIRKKLRKAGARKVFDAEIDARFYDFPDKRIQKQGNHLRLRKIKGQKIELTFKKLKSKKKYKHNDETDIVIDDFNAMHKALISLGLTNYKGYKKRRERYKIGKYQYEIDKYPQIPHFVEIEAKSESAAKAKKELEKAVKILGYTMKDTKPWNGFEVHKHYHKKI